MKVFVTGASGFVGSATVRELAGAGHAVVGLARSDAAAAVVEAAGGQVRRGSLEELDVLREASAAADGVIHLGFVHDFSRYAESAGIDRAAIEAMGAALAGSGKPLVVTSGVALLSPGATASEETPSPVLEAFPRVSEPTGLAFVDRGVRAMVIRLAPSVHGAGDHGFVPMAVGAARGQGVSAYVGDGSNRWPAVHRLDAARLYRLALEHGAAGDRFHGVAEEGVAFRDIAELIGARLGLPVVSKTPEEAATHFGFLSLFMGLDCPASSALTQARLGWTPTEPGLLADMAAHYFGG